MEKANLIIDQATAKRLYPNAGQEVRAIFEATFGKGTFSQKITDRVKTFQDACEIVGIDSNVVNAFEGYDERSYFKLKTIIRALNEGWMPDWNNDDEYKYYPRFDTQKDENNNPSGFRLCGCYGVVSRTVASARLVYRTQEIALYAGKQFLELYRGFMLLD